MNDVHQIKTGIPGTFYRKPSPSEPNFIEEGASVAVGATIGLVEIMKSFHPVTADRNGVLDRFLVEHESQVAPGQDIAEIRLVN
ncbi:acetyl-CoA carboxylase [Arthrobacter sp. OAP107]|uniref:acetyl-CoA carboxylase n=1 Tax=Arthrobacter sp. OAP107 TaxID=3156445 RepID=UPI0033996A65